MASPSRAFNIRSTGLYKKGNTLFNMFHPKVAVIVDHDMRPAEGYVSHKESEWPELFQFLDSYGIRRENISTPDRFDTVAERYGDRAPQCSNSHVASFSSGSTSTESTTSGTTTSTSPSLGLYSDSNMFADLYGPLAEENAAAGNLPFAELASPPPIAGGLVPPPPAEMPPPPQRTPVGVSPPPPVTRVGTPILKEHPNSTGIAIHNESSKRRAASGTGSRKKRKTAGSYDGRRLRMITRSQDPMYY